jgi:hypothetical protein
MPSKVKYLRLQAAAYWQDARAQQDAAVAQRLVMLAIRCQEMILELEHEYKANPASPSGIVRG